jgi:hypothetical protein
MASLSVPESSSYLPGVLFGSRTFLALRWTMPGTIFGEVASHNGFTLWLRLPTWGVNVDGLVCPLDQPMTHSYQARGQGQSARRCPILLLQ